MSDPAPSSATSGFFQTKPTVLPLADEDLTFQRCTSFFLPQSVHKKIQPELSSFSRKVLSPEVLTWIVDAEENPPSLRHRDTFGRAKVRLVTSEGWRNLQDLGIKEGIVARGYENQSGDEDYARLVQFLRLLIWSPSSALVSCPSAMHDGAAALLMKYVKEGEALGVNAEEKRMFESVLGKLKSRKPGEAWTSGQWMTERTGGSDVRGTETRAHPLTKVEVKEAAILRSADGGRLGDWAIDGFKWFSSATDADMSILLAKTPGSDDLSVFYAPMKRERLVDGRWVEEFNGVYPQRLKNKMGTKALPTAELELKGMRAHLLGKKGLGVKQISAVLTLTRIHTAIGSAGYLSRGLAISRAFAKVRKVGGGRLLIDIPVHVKSMAKEHVEYKANLMLALFTVAMLGVTETGRVSPLVESLDQAKLLLRLLTPIAKAQVSQAAVDGLRASMESLGGVGYLENNDDPELNIARIFRDANVNCIWEGTSNIMADDTIRVLAGREGPAVLDALISWCRFLSGGADQSSSQSLLSELERVKKQIVALDRAELAFTSPNTMASLGWAIAGTLLIADASRDNAPIAKEVAARWLGKRDQAVQEKISARNWKEVAQLDRAIVFGSEVSHTSKL